MVMKLIANVKKFLEVEKQCNNNNRNHYLREKVQLL